jgi:DNA-binding NtrC family response regulator
MSDRDPKDAVDIETDWAAQVDAGSASRAYLVVTSDHRVIPIGPGERLLVGRSEECEIQLPGPSASRRHAVFAHVVGQGIVVEDLGGKNGTRVGRRVLHGTKALLGPGDVCTVGEVRIVLAVERSEGWCDALPAPPANEDDGQDLELAGVGVVVGDPAMKKVYLLAQRVAQRGTTALILGETGVGKEVIASFLHQKSPRAAGPYVRLSCASLPDTLLESELFGHEKGAFTGADRRKTGYVEAAMGGTLFLDEIGELPLATQVKLLRVLENRTITRLGGTIEVPVDVRVVCATHRNLRDAVAGGTFREDLYYRISAFVINVPPLRDRRDEIGLLANACVVELSRAMDLPQKTLSAEVSSRLLEYPWPGNVRELKNAIEHALVVCDGPSIQIEHLPGTMLEPGAKRSVPFVDSADRAATRAALEATAWNQTHAAARLGISRRGLIYKMRRYGLKKPMP